MIRPGLAAAAAVAAAVALTCPAAGAVSPPSIDPQVAPPDAGQGPSVLMTQRGACTGTGVIPGTDPALISPNQLMLNLSDAWKFSRGEGQAVAIIDTGVQPGPRLPNVEGGGDYLAGTDGLTDCDGHGTLVAGLVAGQPGADGFSGVAPAARLISIRQTSAKFAPQSNGADPVLARAEVDVDSLARAIVRAADLGARVINVSVVTCLPANKTVDQSELGAALKYAAVDRDAVIVAAAGNNRSGLNTGFACEPNPLTDPARPDDPRNWADVASVSIPSWWQPYVLSVGSVTPDGRPSTFTMAGPWVGLAAPGENVVSVSNGPDGGLANGVPNNDQEFAPISGTSYSAAYTSGVVALVRSKYPDLSASEVVSRITQTAHTAARSPSNLVGSGALDPVAALTWDVPTAEQAAGQAPVGSITLPPPPVPEDDTPKIIAFAGAGALAIAVAATAAITARRRKDLSQ